MDRASCKRIGLVVLLAACTPDEPADDDSDVPMPASSCEFVTEPPVDFDPAGGGSARHDLAADITLTDQHGPWTLSDAWTGCDSYVVIPDVYTTFDGASFWEAPGVLADLIARSPLNVHYLFVSAADTKAARAERLAGLQKQLDKVTKKLDAGVEPGQAGWWDARIHLVQESPEKLGWFGEALDDVGGGAAPGFGIDRTQRLRGVGSFADVNLYDGSQEWPFDQNMAFAAHEPIYWNYERARDLAVEADGADVVSLWDGVVLQEYADVTVDLPSAAQMATYDTLTIDLTAWCPTEGTEVGNCGAWDYIANLSFLEDDGVTWTEITRWITTYHREGRYIVDASGVLPLLADGGSTTFRYSFAPSWNVQPTFTRLSLRFSDQGRPYRPTAAIPLWRGGGFDANYAANHPPMTVDVPTGTTHAELWTIITGHGGVAGTNCAEFCNHTHTFGIGEASWTKDHPEVGDTMGCANKIAQGVVPNQWGTWWYGRGGWCPGQQVDPWTVDVTDHVTAGQPVTITYDARLGGDPPTTGQGDISMSSWLVTWAPK